MKILEALQTIANVNDVTFDFMVVTYSPAEGLNTWWIKNGRGGFKYPHFVIETMEQDKKTCWWVKKAYDGMDWGNNYLYDEDNVDLGPFPFAKPALEFIEHYRALHEPLFNENDSNCNVVGVDYEKIKNMKVSCTPYKPRTTWETPLPPTITKPPAVSFDTIMDPQFPITYVVNGNSFQNLKDVDKFIRYGKLRHMMFDGLNIYDETQLEVVRRIIKNQGEFMRLLKGL